MNQKAPVEASRKSRSKLFSKSWNSYSLLVKIHIFIFLERIIIIWGVNYRQLSLVMAAILNFRKNEYRSIYCLCMGNMHSEINKYPAHIFRTVHTFWHLRDKLSIIITCNGGHIEFKNKIAYRYCAYVWVTCSETFQQKIQIF